MSTWSAKDPSVVSEAPAQVVDEAPGVAKQVATLDIVDGKPVVNVTSVASDSQAEQVVAAEQKQSETVAVSVGTVMQATVNYGLTDPDPALWFAKTSSNDPLRAQQSTNFDTVPEGIWRNHSSWAQAEYPWSRGRGQGVVVAVVDTGVDGTHPDLTGQVLPGFDLVSGATGPQAGWNDQNSHGTHVAGIIAAKDNNGVGMAGLAPDVKILPIRVLGADGSGMSSTVAKGVITAVDAGAHIISMSLGSPQPDPVLQSAIEYAIGKGVVVIAAGGNIGMPGYITFNGWSFPASYEGVIGVGAQQTNCGGIGGDHIDVAAPGCAVLSTTPNGQYQRYSGTSMATPQVAAEAADLMSSGVPASEIEAALEGSTDIVRLVIAWDCKEDADSTPTSRKYTCYPNGADWPATHAMWGAGSISPVKALQARGSTWSQGLAYPNVSSGLPVAPRPVSKAPDVLPAPAKPWAPKGPAAPTGLKVSASYESSVDLAWDPVENAASYELEIVNADTSTRVDGETITAPDTQATFYQLDPTQHLRARVKVTVSSAPVTEGRVSDWSEWVDLHFTSVPAFPQKFAVVTTAGSTVITKMTVPPTATRVEVKAVNKATGHEVISGVDGIARHEVQVALTGLTRDATYELYVRAINPQGPCRWVVISSVVASGLNLIGDVSIKRGNQSAVLSWAPDSLATAYRVKVTPIVVPPGVTAAGGSVAVSVAAGTATITRLTPGVRYSATVTPVAPGKAGRASAPVEFTPYAVEGPHSASATQLSASQLQISFAPVAGARSYRVCLVDEAVGTPTCTTAYTSPVTRAVKASHTYAATVSAFVDGSFTSAASVGSTYVKGVPYVPAAPKLKESTPTTATVTLPVTVRVPAGAPGVTDVLVRYWDGRTLSEYTVPLGTTSHTATGLVAGREYVVTVAGVNADGVGSESAGVVVSVRTVDTPVLTRSSTAITWPAVADATSYRVSFEDASGIVLASRVTSARSVAMSSLPPGSARVVVRAVSGRAVSHAAFVGLGTAALA